MTPANDTDNNFFAHSSELDAEEKFKHAEKFVVTCPLCGTKDPFPGIFRDYAQAKTGLSCKSCGEIYTSGCLQNQLDLQVRACIQKFYEGWLECDEHSCRNRTRQPHFYKTHSRCIVPGCKGVQKLEYTSEHLYNQLQYFQYVFDVDKYQVKPPQKPHLKPIRDLVPTHELNTFSVLQRKAGTYLAQSALHHVNLGMWFSYYDVIVAQKGK